MQEFNKWYTSLGHELREGFAALNMLPWIHPKYNGQCPQFGNPSPEVWKEIVDKSRPKSFTKDKWRKFCWNKAEGLDGTVLAGSWGVSGLFSQGIKAYCPTDREFSSLAQVEIALPWDCYRQPFETTLIVLPKGVREGLNSTKVKKPVAVICRYSKAGRFTTVILVGAGVQGLFSQVVQVIPWTKNIIETDLGNVPSPTGDMKDEAKPGDYIRRAAINANLLLVQYGAKRLRSADPKREQRLEELLQKKRSNSSREALATDLRNIPVIYGFEQEIKIYEEYTDKFELLNQTDRVMKPHWRRGHWSFAPYQRELGDKGKRVFKKPVMVNRKYFLGQDSDTKVTMVT